MAAAPEEIHEDDIVGRAYDARMTRRVLRYLRPYRGLALLGFALTLGATLVGAVPNYMLGQAVDRGIVPGDEAAIARYAWLYFGFWTANLVLGYGQHWAISLLGSKLTLDLRMDLARKVVHQSMTFFAREPVGRVVTRIMNDVGQISDLFTGGLIQVINDVFAIAVSAGILLWIDARLAALTFLVVPLLYALLRTLNRRIRENSREVRRLLARVAAYIAESMNGIRVLQLFGREAENARRFRSLNDRHLDVQLRAVYLHALYVTTITVVTTGAVGLLIWKGGGAALQGRIELGVFIAFLGYAGALFQPIRDIAEKYAVFQQAMASAERVFKLMDEPVEVTTPAAPRALPRPVRGEIEFREVWFEYPRGREGPGTSTGTSTSTSTSTSRSARDERRWALRGVSFKIRPGERVAIVGHTGAGKSTLVNLLGRFHDPTRGQVLVDGIDVRELDERALRREIGVVLQDVFVFAGSIAENITLGDERIPPERARAAAVAVHADAWIARLPRGYDEGMRERGATLSTGQKQLLSFARALAFDPRVLVLDEATASVDPETERLLQDAIRTVLEGRTSLVIAHRMATIRDADRVLVLHRGELAEEGSPRELLAREGSLFGRLWRLQYEGAPPV